MKVVMLGAGRVFADMIKNLTAGGKVTIVGAGAHASNGAAGVEVVETARERGIPIVDSLDVIDKFAFDCVFMLSYPPLITGRYLKKYRFVNTHYAPLPRYRGMHGFVWSIINGEKRVGYTIHRVEEGIDNGAIYHQYLTELTDDDDVNSVIGRLNADIVANIEKILLKIGSGAAPVPQDESQAIYVTRRRPEDGKICWTDGARNIFNLVRALTPPYTLGAFTLHKGEPLYIVRSRPIETPSYIGTPGKIVNIDQAKGILVKAGDGCLYVTDVIYKGKRGPAGELFKTVGVRLG